MTSEKDQENASSGTPDATSRSATGVDAATSGSESKKPQGKAERNPEVRVTQDTENSTELSTLDKEQSALDKGQVGLIALVVLAVLASVVMLITGNSAAQKIALLAALWAAVIGFFLVAVYRRQAEEKGEELVLREKLHEAELKRVEAERDAEKARKESANTKAALGAGNLTDEDLDVLRDIREELKSIRAQIDDIAGEGYTYVPASLRAEARRVQELEGRAGATLSDAAFRSPATSNLDTFNPATSSPATLDGLANTSQETGQAVPDSSSADFGDSADFGEIEFAQESSGAPSADAIAGRLGAQPKLNDKANPLASLIQERGAGKPDQAGKANQAGKADQAGNADQAEKPLNAGKSPAATFDTGSFQAIRWDQGGDAKAKNSADSNNKPNSAANNNPAPRAAYSETFETKVDGEPIKDSELIKDGDIAREGAAHGAAKLETSGKTQPATPTETTPETPATQGSVTSESVGRRGRRRSDAAGEGALTVAELLAKMKKDK